MTIQDKKKQVLSMLSNTNDSAVIEEVYALLHNTDTMNDIEVNELPGPLQTKIKKAMVDYKTGNYITQDEMKHKLKTWLSK